MHIKNILIKIIDDSLKITSNDSLNLLKIILKTYILTFP